MTVDPAKIMALRDRYLEQAAQFQLDADRHRGLADRAADRQARGPHERAFDSYSEQALAMRRMADQQQRALQATAWVAPRRVEVARPQQERAQLVRQTVDRDRSDRPRERDFGKRERG